MIFRPKGDSMKPMLQEGDIVTIAPAKYYRKGDIVLSKGVDGLVLHRFVGKVHGNLFFKGDALISFDPSSSDREILGVAVARERGGKVVRLDTFGARFRGLGFCLATLLLPRLVPLLGALRRWVRRLTLRPFS